APAPDLLVFVLDAGRREGGGVVRLSGPVARAGAKGTLAPADLAPTVLSVLGVAASREIAGRARSELLVPGAVDGETVASWGRRRADTRPPVDPKEYVENLRSLGYLGRRGLRVGAYSSLSRGAWPPSRARRTRGRGGRRRLPARAPPRRRPACAAESSSATGR